MGLGAYSGILSGNDINRGILIVAIHECCLSIHLAFATQQHQHLVFHTKSGVRKLNLIVFGLFFWI